MPPSAEQRLDRRARHRLAIIRQAEEVTGNVAQTCRYYGISRNAYYIWYRRYQAEGIEGLRDRSSRPKTSPNHLDSVDRRPRWHRGPAVVPPPAHARSQGANTDGSGS